MSGTPGTAQAAPAGAWRSPLDLVLQAVAAEVTYLVVVLVPLVPLVLLQRFFFGPTFALWCGLAMALGMWWVVQAVAHEPEGEPLPEGTPLAQAVADLCKELDAPPLHRILLTDELNASAHQRGVLSLFGVRRTLSLGLPLLRLLSPQELRAVIAHELGHFSRQHGRLGHWVYLVRSKWDTYLYGSGRGDGFVDMVLRAIAMGFVPAFVQRSSAWSKACEFEADAHSVRASGSRVVADALTKVQLASWLLREPAQQELARRRLAGPQPPGDFWDLVHRLAREATEDQFQQALHAEDLRPPRLHDTHPPLAERVAAAGAALQRPHWESSRSAGQELLADHWSELFAACQRRWQEKASLRWRLDHARLRWIAARLDDAHAPLAEAERVVLRNQLEGTPDARQALAAMAAAQPQDALLQFELARCQLESGDDTGRQTMAGAVKLDRRLSLAGARAIHAHLESAGSDEQLQQSIRRLEAAHEHLSWIGEPLRERILRGPLTAMETARREVLASAIAADAFVDGCWAACTEAQHPKGLVYPVGVLVVRLDTARLQQAEMQEHEVRSSYADLLAAVSPPHHVAWVRTVLTTEPVNPHMLAQLEAAGGALVAPRSVINADIIRIDSL